MKLRSDLTIRQLGDESIIVDPSQDMVDMTKVFTLNETAAFLWNQLQGQDFSVDNIVTILLENYDVTDKVARQDAQLMIDSFTKQGLLVI